MGGGLRLAAASAHFGAGQHWLVVCCIQAFWHEYFGIGMGTSFLRCHYIPSSICSMFVVVAQGVQIRILDSPWAQVLVRRFSFRNSARRI